VTLDPKREIGSGVTLLIYARERQVLYRHPHHFSGSQGCPTAALRAFLLLGYTPMMAFAEAIFLDDGVFPV